MQYANQAAFQITVHAVLPFLVHAVRCFIHRSLLPLDLHTLRCLLFHSVSCHDSKAIFEAHSNRVQWWEKVLSLHTMQYV